MQALILLVLALMPVREAAAGGAFIARDLRVVPTSASSNDSLSALVSVGQCLGISDSPSEIDVTMTGSAVNLLVDGHIALDDAACIFPPGTFTFPIGRLPPGRYTVNFQVREFFPPHAITVEASTSIQVSAPSVPALGTTSVIALSVFTLGLGLAAAFTRQRKRALSI